MLGPGRVPVYVPPHFQTKWLRDEEKIIRIGHTVHQTISCTQALQGARQAKRCAQEQAQTQLQAARAASRLFEGGINYSTPQQRQALSRLDTSIQDATSQLQTELDVDVLRIWKVLLYYKSAFAGVVFNGKDPHVWEQDFGASEFSPRMYHCLHEFKLYFQELAVWGAKTRSDNDRLLAELEKTTQALKEATALIDKAAAPELSLDFVPTPRPSTTTSATHVAPLCNPGAVPLYPGATPSIRAAPARVPHVQLIAISAEQPHAEPTLQPLSEPEALVDSQLLVVEDAMGKADIEPVTDNKVRPFTEVEPEVRREVEHEVVSVAHVDLGKVAAVPGSEVKSSEPVQDVLGVGSTAVIDHERQVVSEPEVETVVEPAVGVAVQPESAAAAVSVVDTAAHPEVQQAQNTLCSPFQQYRLRQGSSGPAVPGVGKCPAGFYETTVTILEEPAMQPTPMLAPAAVDSAEPAELGVPAEPAASETSLMGGGASSDGSVLGTPCIGSAQPQSPAWAISAQHVPGADLLQDASHEDGASATDPEGNSVTAQSTPLPLPVNAETTTNAHRPGIDSQHAQHAEIATCPSSEAMHAAKAWALPILRKIKGSPAGVEELWNTLHNSPRTEALAICEATLGKSTQVASFVVDFLGRVSEDRSGDDVGTMDAGDPAPPVVSKSKKRKMKKKAARATPPSYPSPQALEAARGWAVSVIQRLQGSSEGVSEFWGSLESTPVTEVVLVCEDRLGKSASVTSFLNKLTRSISGDEVGNSAAAMGMGNKLSNAEKRRLRRWSKQQAE